MIVAQSIAPSDRQKPLPHDRVVEILDDRPDAGDDGSIVFRLWATLMQTGRPAGVFCRRGSIRAGRALANVGRSPANLAYNLIRPGQDATDRFPHGRVPDARFILE